MQRYLSPIFEEITLEQDILFATLPGYDDAHTPTPLHLDVYYPAGDQEKDRRAVILVHGGGFWLQNKQQNYIVILAKALARYGYVCFSVDYRLFPCEQKQTPQVCQCVGRDIEEARKFIAENSARFGIDPHWIALGGGSAGGMGGIEASRLYPEYAAFLCLWGAYPGAQASPLYPPTLIIHGTADPGVPFQQGEAFLASLHEHGIPASLFPLPGAGHTAIDRLPDFEAPMIRFLNGERNI